MTVASSDKPAPHPDAVVVKLGGDVLEGTRLANVAAALLAAINLRPRRFVIVHGGGAQVTALSTKLGLPTTQIAGRRVTDEPTLDVLKMVIAGRLNVDLAAALRGVGVDAIGLHAGSGVIAARRRAPAPLPSAGPDPVDLGLVGDVTGFDMPLIETLWAAGRVPVLSCMGLSPEGQVLNINADMTASQLATLLVAEALVAVTAVGGVRRDKDDPATLIPRLTINEARAAIAAGVVQGGMIAKLEEAFAPLAAGVGSVQIVAPHEIALCLATPGAAGTTLVRDA